jgi:hypothetical protein
LDLRCRESIAMDGRRKLPARQDAREQSRPGAGQRAAPASTRRER